ncbi:hypothetical protein HY642_06630 [Candidatus Woesearchaeota archaeon]|nr:hypothetical protein [Candidatus Woesearchaeota archaeon]
MELQQAILRKLFRRRIIGGKHTAFEHITAGIPKDMHGSAKNAAEELIKQGLILTKPTSYGLQISLNPERIAEIIKIIEGK